MSSAPADQAGRRIEPMHQSILDYKRYRYLWISLVLCAAAIALYFWHQPIKPRGGDTWVGYTLGGIAAALIVWLLWLGIRKRSYKSTRGTVRGWTSAHVYLGLSVLVLATFHTGFSFGWNVHTLAYALMVLVLASGVWGVVVYMRNPERMTLNRDGMTRQAMAAELSELDEECLSRADAVGPEVHRQVVSALGNDPLRKRRWRTLLSGRHWVGKIDPADPRTLEQVLAEILASRSAGTEVEAVQRLLDVVARRRRLSARLARELRLQAQMELWLYLHVPLSIALLAALLTHIVVVFFYW